LEGSSQLGCYLEDRVPEDAPVLAERRGEQVEIEQAIDTDARVELQAPRRRQASFEKAACGFGHLTQRATESVDVAPGEPRPTNAEASGARVQIDGARDRKSVV